MSRAKDAADLGALLSSATANRGKTAAAVVPTFVAAAAKEPTRRERLAQLEHVVEVSALTFRRAQARHYREVGPALEEIRDQELYADAGYASWLDYLHRRWEYSEAHAYRFIEMGRVAAALAPLGDAALEALTAESHARELAPVLRHHGEEAVRRVWQEVIADPSRKVTAKRVVRARAAVLGPTSPIGEVTDSEHQDLDRSVLDGELIDDDDAIDEMRKLLDDQRALYDRSAGLLDAAVAQDPGAAEELRREIRGMALRVAYRFRPLPAATKTGESGEPVHLAEE